ncbi:MAG: hypothetical protein JO329_01985 [Planctomycetaceae bacterium]|nr:hypothetical protein [Planctomycetaceae bacterium]
MLRELVSADVLEGATLEGRDDEAAASGRGARACDPPPPWSSSPPLAHAPRPVLPVLRPPPPGAAPRAAAVMSSTREPGRGARRGRGLGGHLARTSHGRRPGDPPARVATG